MIEDAWSDFDINERNRYDTREAAFLFKLMKFQTIPVASSGVVMFAKIKKYAAQTGRVIMFNVRIKFPPKTKPQHEIENSKIRRRT